MLPVDEVSMAVDPDEYASLRKKLRAWAQLQVERERRREWLIRIIVAALLCVWLYLWIPKTPSGYVISFLVHRGNIVKRLATKPGQGGWLSRTRVVLRCAFR